MDEFVTHTTKVTITSRLAPAIENIHTVTLKAEQKRTHRVVMLEEGDPMHSNKHIPDSMEQLVQGVGSGNNAIANKVIEDIQFLKDRIDRIRKLQTPNSTVLKTYQSMLESRESVLEWLLENGDADLTSNGTE